MRTNAVVTVAVIGKSSKKQVTNSCAFRSYLVRGSRQFNNTTGCLVKGPLRLYIAHSLAKCQPLHERDRSACSYWRWTLARRPSLLSSQYSGEAIISSSLSRSGAAGADSPGDRKSTRLNSSHVAISYAFFCLKKTS